uniref:Phospholipase-like, aminotransferase-like mobile domain protein n=1 Tax=Tanacetum cinerariifolium TaxID=118510 RepID=A0A6L2MFN6_TANCI|nr:phospholipase-like, aminotransferase-like mobile domain protein [Tanacetum cinerariifolium]
MKDRLGLDRCVLFRLTCFWRWLDLSYVKNEEDLIHYMLQMQKVSDNDHYDLPLIYNVNGHTLHFGRREFCLITSFKFGFNSFHKFREGDISFRDRVFPKKIGEYVKSIDLISVIKDEERFTSLSDEDSIRVCLLLSLEVIFMGHELGYAVDDVFLRMVDNLEAWYVFPCGEQIWWELYTTIRNVNSKHKDAHHKALEIKPNFVSSYSLSGFVLYFKEIVRRDLERPFLVEAFSISKLGVSWATFYPAKKKPNYDLYRNKAEAQSEWFTKSNDFFKWYALRAPPVEYGGLSGDYLKKLSSARTLRDKDREAWSDKVESVGKQCHMGDKCWSDQDDAFDDLVDANAKLEEVDKDLSQDDYANAKKQEAEQRRLRMQLMLEEENNMKSIDRSNYTHIKLALEKCKTTKRRQSCQDWSMVSCNFLTLLLQESMPLFYATDEIYPLAWRDAEQVFISNKPIQETFDVEIRPWYVKIRRCLESKLYVALQETSVFVSKGIDPTHYSIKFRHTQNIPKQGGVFSDCGIFVCLFLYRLAHGIPLDVEDPIQTVLAYREKVINFFFDHKIFFPS